MPLIVCYFALHSMLFCTDSISGSFLGKGLFYGHVLVLGFESWLVRVIDCKSASIAFLGFVLNLVKWVLRFFINYC